MTEVRHHSSSSQSEARQVGKKQRTVRSTLGFFVDVIQLDGYVGTT